MRAISVSWRAGLGLPALSAHRSAQYTPARRTAKMVKASRPYIVTRYDPVERLDENLWAVNGDVPGFPPGTGMDRRMSIVRLRDGRLVFHNAVPLNDSDLAEVTSWGTPAALIVPVHLHAIDAAAFRERLGLAVFTSRIALEQVRAIVAVDGTLEDLALDDSMQCVPLAGTRFGEAAWVVRSGPRSSLLFCDALHASRPGSGFNGFIFRVMGFTGPEPKVPPLYRLRAVTDRHALKAVLLRLARTPGLVRLVPSHGRIVTEDPAGALQRAAEQAL